jgi:alkanesulfonate monooxygenase
MASRQIKLNAFMRPASIHTGAWRYPGAWPDMNFNFAHIKEAIQKLEAARFDAFFMADHMAVLNMPMDALKRSHTSTSFEPFTLLSALSQATSHIGLVATGSTTFDVPYHIARRFASLDHISGGRAGWNIVTTSNPDAALNFGLEEHMEHGERYRRAREFYDVVTGLWDSWADDAFIRDVDSGVFFDPDKMHTLNHKGEFLSVKGPLNIARPIQGWPLIVQAGASESGKQLAAETAEAVFTSQSNIEAGKAFYADVKGRMQKLGRNPEHLKIQPACFVVVGDTVDEAKAKRAKLDSLVYYANSIASLSIALGTDASKFDPDGPLPDIPDSNASKSGRERAIAAARRDNLTVRQLAQRMGGYSGLAMVGTPKSIADEMEEWMETRASDGFTIMFPYLPGGLDDFVRGVIPELQRRGLFRREYEGKTLRENLGLPRPENRFFDRSKSVAAE